MVSAGDFRNGITVEIDNQIFQIIEFQHVKPGKGAAFVRTKLKNIVKYTFNPLLPPTNNNKINNIIANTKFII